MTTGPDRGTLRSFLILWVFQAFSLLGTQAVQFALVWWIARETGSATVLATAAFLGLAPQVALGPFAGALVDRWDRRRVMLAADGATALASLILAGLFAADLARMEFVYLALLARSIGSTFHGPAMLASTSLMVPREQLGRIQGLNQTLQGSLLIVSAPLGGVLLATLAMPGILLVDVITAALAMAPLGFIRVPRPQHADPGGAGIPTMWRDVGEGLRYLAARPGHVAIVGMGTVINLMLVPAFSLLPLLVLEELRGGAMQLAWMNSALGIGSIAGGLLLGVWGGFRRRIVTTLAALWAFGGAVLALGLATDAATATLAMGCVGAFVPLVNGPIQAVLQATVAPEFQGRVFTLIGSLAGLAAPLGLALAAPVAELAGVRAWYVAGAAACMLMGGAGFLTRAVLEIERSPDGLPEPP